MTFLDSIVDGRLLERVGRSREGEGTTDKDADDFQSHLFILTLASTEQSILVESRLVRNQQGAVSRVHDLLNTVSQLVLYRIE